MSPVAHHTTEPITPADFPAVEADATRSLFVRRLPWALSLVLGIVLLAVWSYDRRLLRQVTSVHTMDHPLWSHFFTPGKPTMVVAPDSGLVLFHTRSGQDVDLKSYLDGSYRSEASKPAHVGPDASRMESLID